MKDEKLLYADETYVIRGAAFDVYKEMGNAFDESVYMPAWSLDQLRDVSEGFLREICPLVNARSSVSFACRTNFRVASETGRPGG